MTSKEALKILYPQKSYQPYYSKSERRHACKVIEEELEVLDALKNALVMDIKPVEFKPREITNDYNNFIGYCFDNICEIRINETNKKIKEQLTRWVIDNIDKEKIREWLENDN